MLKSKHKHKLLIRLSLMFFVLISCTTSNDRKPQDQLEPPYSPQTPFPSQTPSDIYEIEPPDLPPSTQPSPEKLEIYITINNYQIVEHRLLTSYEGNIKYTEYYTDGQNVYIRLDPHPHQNYYWIAKLPFFKSGSAQIDAIKYNDDRHKDLSLRPERISIRVVVDEHMIKKHTINNHSEKTIGLYIDKEAKLLDTSSGRICIIKSKIFKGDHWEMLLPVEDGTFDLIANLKKKSN